MSDLKAQDVLKTFFADALAVQREKAKGYGESWNQGRPIGITDNLFWIIVRIRNIEKELIEQTRNFYFADDEVEETNAMQKMTDLQEAIKDDLLDLANFAGFRYAMAEDRRDLT